MVMRACLVALDWNDSIDRRHKALETGELMYREKVLCNYIHTYIIVQNISSSVPVNSVHMIRIVGHKYSI